MLKTTSFNVYNASAGSGKTFTLVKEYLKLLFRSNQPDLFKNILSLTFTNKAVGEMKNRIIDKLTLFSNESILSNSDDTFSAICDELGMVPKMLHEKSKVALNTILHNYAAFDISTIDRFTHKVIRTFAFDLKIPLNFEVELDTETLLSEAVDNLIAQAGKDNELTKVLVDFAIEKADDDKSWDIAYDFNKIAKLLVNENDMPYVESLRDKTLDDFKQLKTLLRSRIESLENDIVTNATDILNLIQDNGLEFNDFSSGYLPKHFAKLKGKTFKLNFDAKWQDDLDTKPLYPKRVTGEIIEVIERIQPDLYAAFQKTKKQVFLNRFYNNFYKNLTPLSVLSAIDKELHAIKDDNGILLISEFNKIIHEEIKHQPTPFIYERLGEKFKHYFIDEFQDTSIMQWENLIPLIDNRLASEEGSAMIVGDAKQAIYRWRGGNPELFIGLCNEDNPFQLEKKIHDLPTNYRSCKSIVDFNNALYKHLASLAFANNNHETLYSKAYQEKYLDQEGYVNIRFLDFTEDDQRDELYPEAVCKTIESVLANGFELKDICILVRKRKEGLAIANYLTEQNIDIISSETLLIDNSEKVKFIVNILQLTLQPDNEEVKADMLYYIAHHLSMENIHEFLKNGMKNSLLDISGSLGAHDINFSFKDVLQLSLYNAVEYIVREFNLVTDSDSYIQFFMDAVLDYSYKESTSINDFLEYWNIKKESLSIMIPEGKNAIQIMTIHRSKGLEFPVVILPYADLNIYKEREPKAWLPLTEEDYNGFSNAFLNFNQDMAEFGEQGKSIYDKRQAELELDNINLLYVTTTRAVEQLHIISKKSLDPKGNEKLNEYSGLLVNYLRSIDVFSESKDDYSFGEPEKQLNYDKVKRQTQGAMSFNCVKNKVNIVTRSGFLWDTNQEKAIEKGNLVHEIMARIVRANDVDFALNDAYDEGLIDQEQKTALKTTIISIVNHPKLHLYYNDDIKVYNERDIISGQGLIIRPDRLVIDNDHNAVIIDYKTGAYDKKHQQQLIGYSDIIESMGIEVKRRILVYINKDIELKEV